MNFTEEWITRTINKANEFFPFNPPEPVEDFLVKSNEFISNLLGDKLVLIQHFGSTAFTEKNVSRQGYKKPHRGSDIDLIVVVANSCNVQEIAQQCKLALANTTLPKDLFEYNFVNEYLYKNGDLHSHPSLLRCGHAKEYGKTIWQRR